MEWGGVHLFWEACGVGCIVLFWEACGVESTCLVQFAVGIGTREHVESALETATVLAQQLPASATQIRVKNSVTEYTRHTKHVSIRVSFFLSLSLSLSCFVCLFLWLCSHLVFRCPTASRPYQAHPWEGVSHRGNMTTTKDGTYTGLHKAKPRVSTSIRHLLCDSPGSAVLPYRMW